VPELRRSSSCGARRLGQGNAYPEAVPLNPFYCESHTSTSSLSHALSVPWESLNERCAAHARARQQRRLCQCTCVSATSAGARRPLAVSADADGFADGVSPSDLAETVAVLAAAMSGASCAEVAASAGGAARATRPPSMTICEADGDEKSPGTFGPTSECERGLSLGYGRCTARQLRPLLRADKTASRGGQSVSVTAVRGRARRTEGLEERATRSTSGRRANWT
jgi:hypothetical protein